MTSVVGKITATVGGKMLETLMHSLSRAWPDTNFNASTKGQRIEKNQKNTSFKALFQDKRHLKLSKTMLSTDHAFNQGVSRSCRIK